MIFTYAHLIIIDTYELIKLHPFLARVNDNSRLTSFNTSLNTTKN